MSTFQVDIRSAPAIRPVWRLAPPKGRMHKTPAIHVPVSVSRPPFSTNDGQLRSVYRLGKTCVLIPVAQRQPYQTQISCFSLFTMSKTTKVQTNIKQSAMPRKTWWPKPNGQNLAAEPRGSMPVAERRQSKEPDEIHQQPEGRMVGRGGLEPPTSRLSGVRSNQLSYRPQKSGNPDRRRPNSHRCVEFGGGSPHARRRSRGRAKPESGRRKPSEAQPSLVEAPGIARRRLCRRRRAKPKIR